MANKDLRKARKKVAFYENQIAQETHAFENRVGTLKDAIAQLKREYGQPCEVCGAYYLPERPAAAKYCSRACAARAHRERHAPPTR